MESSNDKCNELARLREENARLRALLQKHGIVFEEKPSPLPPPPKAIPALSLEEKVNLFRSLFHGREDVFARRWSSSDNRRSGYQPVCKREWIREYCDKSKNKCSDCPNREFQPLGYNDIYAHLEGKDPSCRDVVGVYAIRPDNTCFFLCCDFDDKSCEHGYQDDVRAYVSICREWGVPAYIERSRSGNGAHVWILFNEPIKALTARRLGNAILTEATEHEGRMSFKSYDRFFPNQDSIPEGGFGNLVALPLQGLARKKGCSVFVDDSFNPYSDQWAYLLQMKKMSLSEVEAVLSLYGNAEPLGRLSKCSESEPWKRPEMKPMEPTDFPKEIRIIRSSGLYVPMSRLSAKVVNHLKRLAAFRNPEFYAKLGMRLPTYNIPRIISCSEIVDDYLWLPRGCEDAVTDFFNSHSVSVTIEDKTNPGVPIKVSFLGELRNEQAEAIDELSRYRCGTINAVTAFGKTVASIALIARKKVNTLILVHTKTLLNQWREKLERYLSVDFIPEEQVKGRGRRKRFQRFGALTSTENSLNGKIDVALLQSCLSDTEIKSFVQDYGMVIVDECHHAPAVNFERVLKGVKARWVYGLTATPIRKDGHQPIIFMQCGEIRFTVDPKSQQQGQAFNRFLIPRFTSFRNLSDEMGYTAILHALSEDEGRNRLILEDVKKTLDEGRSPIILSELTSHVDCLADGCRKICPNVIRLVGNDSAKSKKNEMERLKSIPDNAPLVIVATGKYVGEGFDLPRLDTLMLALPVSWKGRIAQYTGRLHRDYTGKTEVRIYDYIDIRIPICESMYGKRLNGYKGVGYSVAVANEGLFAEPSSEAIFDSDTFERPFHTDLGAAKQSIVISVDRLRWNRTPRIIELLAACTLRGVAITIVIAEIGYHESELQSMGIRIIHHPGRMMSCAIIDQCLGWYGTINLIGRSRPGTIVIRMPSPDFAAALLDALGMDNLNCCLLWARFGYIAIESSFFISNLKQQIQMNKFPALIFFLATFLCCSCGRHAAQAESNSPYAYNGDFNKEIIRPQVEAWKEVTKVIFPRVCDDTETQWAAAQADSIGDVLLKNNNLSNAEQLAILYDMENMVSYGMTYASAIYGAYSKPEASSEARSMAAYSKKYLDDLRAEGFANPKNLSFYELSTFSNFGLTMELGAGYSEEEPHFVTQNKQMQEDNFNLWYSLFQRMKDKTKAYRYSQYINNAIFFMTFCPLSFCYAGEKFQMEHQDEYLAIGGWFDDKKKAINNCRELITVKPTEVTTLPDISLDTYSADLKKSAEYKARLIRLMAEAIKTMSLDEEP